MKEKYRKELPLKGELFLFILISILHLTTLLFVYFDKKFAFLIIIEIIFFLYNYKNKYKIVFKSFSISIMIFLVNLFFSEGKIIFHYGIIKITVEGLDISIKRSILLLLLFLFTLNNFKDRKDIIMNAFKDSSGNNLIYNSINYFLVFWDIFTENGFNKRFVIKLLSVYKNYKLNVFNQKKKLIDINYFVYNLIFILVFSCMFFIKLNI